MASNTKLKCLDCNQKFKSVESLFKHIEKFHECNIPQGWSIGRYYRLRNFGQAKGRCVECGKETPFNESTYKYKRYCGRQECKNSYLNKRNERMIKVYGRTNLLDDAKQQKKMLAGRKISGIYTWSDGSKKQYVGSYEKVGLEFLDLVMNMPSDDVLFPSPNVYHYEHDGIDRFYIPDGFIVSLNCELEFKDGGDNPNNHHKIQAVDKVKEKLKDDAMRHNNTVNYIKIVNKDHDAFSDALTKLRELALVRDNNIKIFADDEHIEEIVVRGTLESVSEDEELSLEGLGISLDYLIGGN